MPSKMITAISETVFFGASAELKKKERILDKQIRDVVLKNAKYRVSPLSSEDIIANVDVRVSSGSIEHYLKKVQLRRSFPTSLAYLYEEYDISHALSRSRSRHDIASKEFYKAFEKVNFIMALCGRLEKLGVFLKSFEEAFLSEGENVGLTIAYYTVNSSNPMKDFRPKGEQSFKTDLEKIDEIDFVRSLLSSLSRKYSHFDANLISMPKFIIVFSRSRLIKRCLQHYRRRNTIFL